MHVMPTSMKLAPFFVNEQANHLIIIRGPKLLPASLGVPLFSEHRRVKMAIALEGESGIGAK